MTTQEIVKNSLEYKGWIEWNPTSEEWVDFYESNKVPFDMLDNEYLIIKAEDGSTTFYCYENKTFRKFTGPSIKTYKDTSHVSLLNYTDQSNNTCYGESKRRRESQQIPVKSSKGKNIVINPRNNEQVCAFDLVKDRTKTIKLLTGTWGAGKDLIMSSGALELLAQSEEIEKIVWIRNPIKLKDTPDLGALPGEAIDKLLPYLGPFIDHIGEHSVRAMLTKGSLVVEPLQSLRGRNFKNSILICSEAENLTFDQLKLIVARVAEGSYLFINGDVRQRDANIFEKSQGLEKFIQCLSGEKLFGYVHLLKSERSATASLADKLDKFEGK